MRGGIESRDPSRIAIPPIAGLNAMKLFLQYQASMLRILANNCELAPHIQTVRSAPEPMSASEAKSEPEQRREAA
jgi:hypothetical protein